MSPLFVAFTWLCMRWGSAIAFQFCLQLWQVCWQHPNSSTSCRTSSIQQQQVQTDSVEQLQAQTWLLLWPCCVVFCRRSCSGQRTAAKHQGTCNGMVREQNCCCPATKLRWCRPQSAAVLVLCSSYMQLTSTWLHYSSSLGPTQQLWSGRHLQKAAPHACRDEQAGECPAGKAACLHSSTHTTACNCISPG